MIRISLNRTECDHVIRRLQEVMAVIRCGTPPCPEVSSCVLSLNMLQTHQRPVRPVAPEDETINPDVSSEEQVQHLHLIFGLFSSSLGLASYFRTGRCYNMGGGRLHPQFTPSGVTSSTRVLCEHLGVQYLAQRVPRQSMYCPPPLQTSSHCDLGMTSSVGLALLLSPDPQHFCSCVMETVSAPSDFISVDSVWRLSLSQ